jgi:hypothetical protein
LIGWIEGTMHLMAPPGVLAMPDRDKYRRFCVLLKVMYDASL